MNRLLSVLNYELDSITGETLHQLINEGIGFKPTRIRTSAFLKNGGQLNERSLAKLRSLEDFAHVELLSDLARNGPNLSVVQFSDWGFQALYLTTPVEQHPKLDWIKRRTTTRGFTSGATADADDIYWQGEQSIANYVTSSRPHAHLPKVRHPETDEEMIDIKQNPGRRSLVPGMWMQSAWRMWFGGNAFRFFSPERILSFPEASKIEKWDHDVLFVELYADVLAFADSESRRRQAAFRKWLSMDTIEDMAVELLADRSDSPHEMIRGEFPHGGVWQHTEWLDAQGVLTRRSRSVRVRITEYDANYKKVWTQ